jgi:molybdate transport system permease protein
VRRFTVIAVALAAVAAAGCSSSGSGSSGSSASPSGGTITVFAAASLTGTFTQLGKQFEAAHPGDTVKFSFGPSSGLAEQITSGAPADVFASAAPANMDQVVSAGDASNPQNFAQNTMEVATPPNNPGKVTSVNDLAKKSVKVALCQPQVPCGVVAAEVFKNVGITVKPVTLQPDVKSVLTQVETGNVDAGMVYVTDVMAAGSKVMGVKIPASDNASTEYPIATISSSKHKSEAQAFMNYVLSPAGQQVLTAAGFEKPCPSARSCPVTVAAPSHLTARERARRAARGGASRSVPAPLLAPALIAVGFLVLPLVGLLIRAPWGRIGAALSGADATQALILSLWTATTSTAISLVIGVPLAWVLARTSFPGQRLLRALVTLPLVLPPVVGGVALLLAFGRTGFIGQYLNSWFGLTIPFTPLAVVMAETFVAMPFLIITVEGALRSADQGFEEAAATLGARRMTVFRRVTVPLIAPSLGAGAVLCWARALGEFGATITFAGSFPGQTETMPIAVYYALETDPDAAIALSLVLLLVSVIVLVSLRDHWLRGGSLS